jgi:hypothetical protein
LALLLPQVPQLLLLPAAGVLLLLLLLHLLLLLYCCCNIAAAAAAAGTGGLLLLLLLLLLRWWWVAAAAAAAAAAAGKLSQCPLSTAAANIHCVVGISATTATCARLDIGRLGAGAAMEVAAADGAGRMVGQPAVDAVAVELVAAGQAPQDVPSLVLRQAHSTDSARCVGPRVPAGRHGSAAIQRPSPWLFHEIPPQGCRHSVLEGRI